MTIKENLELINDTLNRAYNNLQELVYEQEVETFVRIKLYDITNITRELIEFIYSQEKKQRQGKNKLKKG